MARPSGSRHRGDFFIDGQYLASSSRDLTAALWRTDRALVERFCRTESGNRRRARAVGQLVVTANSIGRVALWERPSTGPLLRLPASQ